jgi:hydroxymethylpyrimidine pyrophosphatase-like HAD family hydrolase
MRFKAFATDYDGTIAHHGTVDPATVDALQSLKNTGRKLLLVTGREIPDLSTVFSEMGIFDLIVAENGALLYWPETKAERCLVPGPPTEFPDLLRQRGVNTLSVGRVIVATVDPYGTVVQQAITELKLDLDIILNKGCVMVLPKGVDKGFGLAAALKEFQISRDEVVAVGDAENDHSLLRGAGLSAAVANALPELKKVAHWTTPSDHGTGVRELIQRVLAEDPADALPASNPSHAAPG